MKPRDNKGRFINGEGGRETIHGHRKRSYKSSEYLAWDHMKQRCFNPNSKNYKHYGGRGIKVCDRWVNSFENFYNDMGAKPSKEHSIDRINNDGNYEPGNCRWATNIEQQRNRTNSRLIKIDGKAKTVSEWAEITGVSKYVIRQRLDKGVKTKELIAPVVPPIKIRIKEVGQHSNGYEV
jgi:hypothetical protein